MRTQRRPRLRRVPTVLMIVVGVLATACQDDPQTALPTDHPPKSQGSEHGAVNTGEGERSASASVPPDLDSTEAIALWRERQQLDNTVWAAERRAQHYESYLVEFWDALNAARTATRDPVSIFQQLPLESITLGTKKEVTQLAHGITRTRFASGGDPLLASDWKAWVAQWHAAGYRLVQSEWHHAQFTPATDGRPAESLVTFDLHSEAPSAQTRVIVRGALRVVWQDQSSDDAHPLPAHVGVEQVDLLTHNHANRFRELNWETPSTGDQPPRVHPLIVYDLNRDGLDDVIAAGMNRVYWNRGKMTFEPETLLKFPSAMHETAVIADFSGDGLPDFLTVDHPLGNVLLYVGDADGTFNTPPRGKGNEPTPLVRPQVISAGDVDADGDLDLWIAQYQPSYTKGQMPTPYYDAQDGLPAFLLLNDGRGNFPIVKTITESGKQNRRTYGGSFVDLDGDADLDLLVVSDFAGIDVYRNDGRGRFTDVTDEIVDEWHNFGMSVTFGDYNSDGHLDFYIAGMGSTTARRLDALQLGRADMPDIHRMRSIMGYGSRMYLANGDRFVEPTFRDQVNRTGWTWGTTTFDFDNDGDHDLFAANGHSSGKSTKDHCSHFWCHDIYTNNSSFDTNRETVFRHVLQGYLDKTESWDGYQKNLLLMNQHSDGETPGFVSVGFLMGVAAEFDTRAVVSSDLDNDGRADLLVVEADWQQGQQLHVYRNELATDHHWVGVRLRESTRRSPLGGRITVTTPSGVQVRTVVTGDSLSAQHPPVAHFGLGQETDVTRIDVHWADGRHDTLESPAIDRYHAIE